MPAAALAQLQAELRGRGLVHGDLRAPERIGDGHSNLTYRLTDGTASFVLRRPPPPPVPPGAHDVLREAAFLRGLVGSGVPVPAVLITAAAGELLDVPCFVMELIEGDVVTTDEPPTLADPAQRRAAGESLVDTLAALHAVDWQAAGMAGLGRPEGFNGRHLHRMARLVADDEGRPPVAFRAVQDWLASHVPAESGATVVHNDYRLGNVVLSTGTPARVAAVLDWELATLGDPLFDLGYLLASVPVAGRPHTPTQELGTAMLGDGWPDRVALARRYQEATGADLTALPWFETLAHWKLAVLYEYGRRRAVEGIGDLYYRDPQLVRSFLRAAHTSAGLPAPQEDP
ncbi:phosphotransferase family protein [Geodermatophilaceae bacterium NBWT11]|nr:phosphotransferase family protein [Geodermatophilaceae bacterium NBWT11]